MKTSTRVSEKLEREKAALAEHTRLSKLYRENRFLFEKEARKRIEAVIESAPNEELKKKLRSMQEDWNRKMKSAGTRDNRFVLAKTFFWEHFHEVWLPGIQRSGENLKDIPF